ncbi:hypothetical protein BKA62DRAFT_724334 [Auriculariales sp. MPI-PUGE-AT-0066]|nr:hypothetical protein BKA62DRAFT_724334 [Auriculariales sp. MPI-PUGE-AT-0066]
MRVWGLALLTAMLCTVMGSEKVTFALQASIYPLVWSWAYDVHGDGQVVVVSINVPPGQPHQKMQRLDVEIAHGGAEARHIMSISDVTGSMQFEFPSRAENTLSVGFWNHYTKASSLDRFMHRAKTMLFGMLLAPAPDMPNIIVELEVDVGLQVFDAENEDVDVGKSSMPQLGSLCLQQELARIHGHKPWQEQLKLFNCYDEEPQCDPPRSFAVTVITEDVDSV